MERSAFRADAALVELGVDSLVAVEIRSWFLKEVNIDMAVLKILGGASTTDIAHFAIEQVAEELIPGIGVTTRDTTADLNKTTEPASAEVSTKTTENEVVSIILLFITSA
jgi:hybrid polyketide synthase/nonribosomal peptide synthetase ACE1